MKIGIKKSGIIIIGNEILNGKTIEKIPISCAKNYLIEE